MPRGTDSLYSNFLGSQPDETSDASIARTLWNTRPDSLPERWSQEFEGSRATTAGACTATPSLAEPRPVGWTRRNGIFCPTGDDSPRCRRFRKYHPSAETVLRSHRPTLGQSTSRDPRLRDPLSGSSGIARSSVSAPPPPSWPASRIVPQHRPPLDRLTPASLGQTDTGRA